MTSKIYWRSWKGKKPTPIYVTSLSLPQLFKLFVCLIPILFLNLVLIPTSYFNLVSNHHLELASPTVCVKMLVPTLRFTKESLQIRVYSYFPILLKSLIIPSIGSASPSFKNIQKSVSPFFFFKWFSWLKLLMWMVCFRERLFVELFYFWVYLPQTPNPFIRKSKNISFLVITADWSLY